MRLSRRRGFGRPADKALGSATANCVRSQGEGRQSDRACAGEIASDIFRTCATVRKTPRSKLDTVFWEHEQQAKLDSHCIRIAERKYMRMEFPALRARKRRIISRSTARLLQTARRTTEPTTRERHEAGISSLVFESLGTRYGDCGVRALGTSAAWIPNERRR